MKFIFFLIISVIVTACGSDSGGSESIEKGGLNQPCFDHDLPCDRGLHCVDERCSPLPEQTVTIATYNIYDCAIPDAYHLIAETIKQYSIDIIIFQEIQQIHLNPLSGALELLQTELPHTAISSDGGAGEDYIAIFSRYPLTGIETILTNSYRDPISGNSYSMDPLRPVLKVIATPFNTPITLYGLHLKAEYPYGCSNCIERRRAQAAALESYILTNHNPKTELIVIGGDLNTATPTDFEPGHTIDMLSLRSDSDPDNDFTPANITYLPESAATHHRYSSRLDHLILSPALDQRYINNSATVPNVYGSDHRPVLLRVDLGKNP